MKQTASILFTAAFLCVFVAETFAQSNAADSSVKTPSSQEKVQPAQGKAPAAPGKNSRRKQENLKNPFFRSSSEFLKNPVSVADSEAKTEEEMKPYEDVIAGTDQKFRMIPIKGGKFTIGSPESEEGRAEDEGPQSEVTIEPFWIEEHETTWKEFEQFALKILREKRSKQNTPAAEREKAADALATPTAPYDISSISHDNAGKAGYPASGMTLYCAQLYCKWLTMVTGRYYRLPTEAEWEYACRAGTKTAYSFGSDDKQLGDYAWWYDNSDGASHKVKTKKPNAWGLYDMHGNLSEWVLEQYDVKTYTNRKDGNAAPVKKPAGEGFGQTARGGNCEDDETANLRSARRLQSVADWKKQDPQYPQSIWWVTDAAYVGFRVVRPLHPPKTHEEEKLYDPDPMIWVEYSELNQRD